MPCCDGDGDVAQVKPEKSPRGAPALNVTKEAAVFIADILKKEGKEGWGLKIDVIPGGCAGFKYLMDFQQKAEQGDKEFEFFGIKIFLSLMSLGLIKGSTVEYVTSLEATGLKVNNPNITRACGCGKSFG